MTAYCLAPQITKYNEQNQALVSRSGYHQTSIIILFSQGCFLEGFILYIVPGFRSDKDSELTESLQGGRVGEAFSGDDEQSCAVDSREDARLSIETFAIPDHKRQKKYVSSLLKNVQCSY